ncbi:MAG: guanylate kinase [bacterium]
MDKDIIIALIGESGMGKTTIAKELYEKENINVIQSYTTRKPRERNEWGHIFASWLYEIMEGFYINPDELPSSVIAHKKLYNEHYWATKEQFEGFGTSIYIIDPESAKMLKSKVNVPVYTILLTVSSDIRCKRLIENRHQVEALYRLHEDEKIFDKQTMDSDFVINVSNPLQENVNNVLKAIRLIEKKEE